MKIFVTGATGFIGKNFVNLAQKKGHEVTCLIQSKNKKKINFYKNPNWSIGNLRTIKSNDLKKCDAVVHLAVYGRKKKRN